jgi:hypothetical protein
MNTAAAQLSRHIGVPIYSDAGLTEAKVPNIQAAYEKAANVLLVALAGGNFIHHAAGMLESMLAVAPEQYVIDDDILGMALRALSGIRVDEETLAVEVIERVGPGGALPHPAPHAQVCPLGGVFPTQDGGPGLPGGLGESGETRSQKASPGDRPGDFFPPKASAHPRGDRSRDQKKVSHLNLKERRSDGGAAWTARRNV